MFCIGVNSIKSISRMKYKILGRIAKSHECHRRKTWNFYWDFDLVDGFQNIGTHHKFLFPAFSVAFALYFRNCWLLRRFYLFALCECVCVNVSLDFMNERCCGVRFLFHFMTYHKPQSVIIRIHICIRKANEWYAG